MKANPFLATLGLSPTDRALIIHADDVSMCQASLASYAELLDVGLMTSGSVMAPAPWFQATAAFARANPRADLGLHTTLTCEWEGYRWSALTTRDPASGLLDDQGCLPRGPEAIWRNASVDAALGEIEAQMQAALAVGIDITHVDDHMGVWSHPRFALDYAHFCLRHRLPPRATWPDPFIEPVRSASSEGGMVENEWDRSRRAAAELLQAGGLPLFDRIGGLPLEDADSHEARILRFADELSGGSLGLFIAHPALDTPELRAIAPDWRGRVANHRAFASKTVKEDLRDRGIHLVGFKNLRDGLRSKGE